MNELYQLRLQEIKNTLAIPIEQADSTPDMWYELFVNHEDESTESIDSGNTFLEAIENFEQHCETYGSENLSIDIWENRNHPQATRPYMTDLEDGQSYTFYLKNGRKIYRAEYHHCTLSGKHYFAKGDDIYPIEDVMKYSMKACETIDEMPPQILTDDYCGHLIEVTFTSVIPHCELDQIPDSVYDCIMEELKENVTEGIFKEEDTGDSLSDSDENEQEYTVTAGSWRVIQIDHRFMLRIARWVRNFGYEERLTKELFAETYGSVMGDHYHEKWESVFRHDLIKMIAYLDDRKDGQKFCDMIYRQMIAYENRINEKK